MPGTVSTDRDEPRHLAALSGPQEVALRALIGGSSVTAAAQAAGVARATVSRWVHGDEAFVAALADARRDMRAECRFAAGAVVTKALAVVLGVLDSSAATVGEQLRASEIALRLVSAAPELSATEPTQTEDERLRSTIEYSARGAPGEAWTRRTDDLIT